MKKVQVFLPEPDIARLRQEAKSKGISLSEMIRRLISDYWDKVGKRK